MKKRSRWAIRSGVVGALALGAALSFSCSGDPSPTASAGDGAAEGSTDDAAIPSSVPPDLMCADADLFNPSVPDAPLVKGSARPTTTECVRCLDAMCATTIQPCYSDCGCRPVGERFLECALATGGTFDGCAASSTSDPAVRAIFQRIAACAKYACAGACTLLPPEDAGDADGAPALLDAGDAGDSGQASDALVTADAQ